MLDNQRYLTKGVQAEIPLELQLFMWRCINRLSKERDYIQVFKKSHTFRNSQNITENILCRQIIQSQQRFTS